MLPYDRLGVVTGSADEQIGEPIKLAVWQRTEPRETATGATWDWTGEAEIESAALLVDQGAVRRLYVVDAAEELDAKASPPPGRRFTVISAVRHDFLPHVQLRLQEVRGS
jgi:hypothetical protein